MIFCEFFFNKALHRNSLFLHSIFCWQYWKRQYYFLLHILKAIKKDQFNWKHFVYKALLLNTEFSQTLPVQFISLICFYIDEILFHNIRKSQRNVKRTLVQGWNFFMNSFYIVSVSRSVYLSVIRYAFMVLSQRRSFLYRSFLYKFQGLITNNKKISLLETQFAGNILSTILC